MKSLIDTIVGKLNGPWFGNSRTLRRLALAAALTTGIVALDQFTKWLAENIMQGTTQPLNVTAFFNLVLSYNRGVSFGLLSTQHPLMPYVLGTVALALIVLLGLWLWRTSSSLLAIGLTCVFAGAISNAVDRMHDGAVTDFLDFYAGSYHWPTFNLADVAISCGVFVIVFETFLINPDRRSNKT